MTNRFLVVLCFAVNLVPALCWAVPESRILPDSELAKVPADAFCGPDSPVRKRMVTDFVTDAYNGGWFDRDAYTLMRPESQAAVPIQYQSGSEFEKDLAATVFNRATYAACASSKNAAEARQNFLKGCSGVCQRLGDGLVVGKGYFDDEKLAHSRASCGSACFAISETGVAYAAGTRKQEKVCVSKVVQLDEQLNKKDPSVSSLSAVTHAVDDIVSKLSPGGAAATSAH